MLRIYQRLWQVNWAEQWQYRANLLMYLFYWLVSPIVYLSVWSAVARSQGSVDGLTVKDFVAYYLAMLIVDTLTSEITIHLLAYRIQDGTLSGELLKPVHPVLTYTLVNNLAFKALMMMVMVPVWLVLCLLFQPDFSSVSPLSLTLSALAIILGFSIGFLLGAAVTCLAFWTTRIYSISEFYYALVLLFAGKFVPLDLMPGPIQALSAWLPFQLLDYVPIQLALGRLPPDVILRDFGLGLVWLAVALVIFQQVWRSGLRRFSAVGA